MQMLEFRIFRVREQHVVERHEMSDAWRFGGFKGAWDGEDVAVPRGCVIGGDEEGWFDWEARENDGDDIEWE
ncbi:hypothetical protein Tco_1151334 [Tanacetum coccineum]